MNHHLPIPSTIICNNITMDMAFLVQMRQSNKCGKCKEWYNNQLTLGICCEPLSQHSLLLARHQACLLIPSLENNQPRKKGEARNEIHFQQIIPYYLGLHAQNPRLRELDLEPISKRDKDKINMQKQERNTQKTTSPIIQPGLTYESQHLER